MSKTGAIILVEDDPDDQEMIKRVIQKLGYQNEIKIFRDGEEALDYLLEMTEQPFIIISDINMPKMDGIQFKKQIDNRPELRKKSIPFVFLSTAAPPAQVKQAYEYSVQGFFIKGHSLDVLSHSLDVILMYWKHSKHINE